MNAHKIAFTILVTTLLSPLFARAGAYHDVMQTHPSQGEVATVNGSHATLASQDNGVAVRVSTQQLTPGHVYTLWFAVMNNPQACAQVPKHCTPDDLLQNTLLTESDVVYADGAVADKQGRLSFNAFIESNKPSEFWFKGGLTKPNSAEVHLVINDHGPVIVDLLSSMLTSYRGGCKDEGLPAAFPTSAKTDGTPGPNQCQMVQVVRFQQN